MYSRNRNCRDCEDGYELSPEEEELCCYDLPPRYDGNRFARRRRTSRTTPPEKVYPEECAVCQHPSQVPYEVSEIPKAEKPESENNEDCHSEGKGILRLLDGIGGEDLLLIALILTLAGSDEGGEVILFLVLLLLCP